MNRIAPVDNTSKPQVACLNCSLNDLCIPQGLSQKEKERISTLVARRKTLQKGDYLYRQGDKFGGILAIKGGTAKLVALDIKGNEFLTGYFLPGELLGFDALTDDRHHYSAVALETLSFCQISRESFDTLCHDAPNLLRGLFRHAGASLAVEIERNLLNRRTAEERVISFLLDLSDRLSKRGLSGDEFKLTLNRREIGDYLGLALETVSRILNSLEDLGLIRVKAKLIYIPDKEKLRAWQ